MFLDVPRYEFTRAFQIVTRDPKKNATIGRFGGHAVCGIAGVVSPAYQRHEPEKTVFYEVIREHLETFLEHCAARGSGLPRYVENAFRRYLECGILAHGFLRCRCPDCGFDQLVAFSCKERGVCPSCAARRMSDTAAHLVDRVIPRVPVRQWVLSLSRPIRYILARDAKLITGALGIYMSEVFRDLRRRAGVKRAREGSGGAVCGVQRAGGALNGNVHLHALVLDGVYVRDRATGGLVFRKAEPPTKESLERVLRRARSPDPALFEAKGVRGGG